MATDIAFAVGVLALFGARVPAGLKLLVLSVAIVDDIGAILVIAVVYSAGLAWGPLDAAVGLLAIIAVLHRAGVVWWPVHGLLGLGVWLATYASGVHATIAGVALGLLMPTRPLVRHLSVSLGGDDVQPSAPVVRWVRLHVQEMISAAERLAHSLHPWTSFAVVPLFALANAGVPLSRASLVAAVGSPVTLGVVGGLVVDKLVGISGAAWLALRLRVGALPEGVTGRQVVAVATMAGIGFTVSLFIAGLAYPTTPALQDQARVGILAGSVLAAAIGALLLHRRLPPAPGGVLGREGR
jgi:NhaA family Na+:H+ antiporter